jgi:hypothetical protein
MSEIFKEGDIVENTDTFQICNGRYGVVVKFQEDLYVMDNEGQLDSYISDKTENLRVVGHTSTDSGLLSIFV